MHLMIDIETIGTAANTVVLSVGAATFNKEGVHSKKEWTLDMQEQIKKGRGFDQSTLFWWMKQKDEAKKAFDPKLPKISLAEFFPSFEDYIDAELTKQKEKRDELKPWGNGANFDITIIEDMYRNQGPGMEAIPWKFWNIMCFRTFNTLTKAKDLVPRNGIYHNAADDAEFQALCVIAFWKKQASKSK